MDRNKLIMASLHDEQCDLVLKNAKVVNVFTGEIVDGDIAVSGGMIVGVGEYNSRNEVDIGGKYVAPGFINAHVHIESSMASPEVYSMEELRQGTTTIITDPHEIANVGGMTAISDILSAAERAAGNYYVMLPSCVPATPFEHSGAELSAKQLAYFRNDPHVIGLGEMMNVVGVLSGDREIMDKLDAFSGMVIDGHFPLGSGKELSAYISAGINTDHESITYEEAVEKMRAGLSVLVREGSASRNLDEIMTGIIENGNDTSSLAFCTDDKHLSDIRRHGTIRYNIKRSVELGLDPVKAIQIGTINAARIYGLRHIGAIACSYRADMVVLEDLKSFKVLDVYKDGKSIKSIPEPVPMKYSRALLNPINFAPLGDDAFKIPVKDKYSVIGIVDGQIITKKLEYTHEQLEAGLKDGSINKIAVVERHNATGFHAAGYIKGYGSIHGAIASTVAHDSHNIVVVGDNDSDMLKACEELRRIGGGYVIVSDGKTLGSLSLPLAGLVSLKSADDLIRELDEVIAAAKSLGVSEGIDPFITLSFMALPVIPEIRITDCGVFDVTKFCFV